MSDNKKGDHWKSKVDALLNLTILLALGFCVFHFLIYPAYKNYIGVEFYFNKAANGDEINCTNLTEYLGPAESYSSRIFDVHKYEAKKGNELGQCQDEVASLIDAHCSYYLKDAKTIIDMDILSFHPGPNKDTINYCQNEMKIAVKDHLRGVVINDNSVELFDYGLILKKDSITQVSEIYKDRYMSHWMFEIKSGDNDFKIRFGDLELLSKWRNHMVSFINNET